MSRVNIVHRWLSAEIGCPLSILVIKYDILLTELERKHEFSIYKKT